MMNEKLKKTLAGVSILGAFGLGGAAIAGAQSGGAGQPASHEESGEKDQIVTGAAASDAGRAALQSVGDGKVIAVEKETPEQGIDKPEAGDRADSAKEQASDQKAAYSVEVQRADGTTIDVTLDSAYNVLDSEQDSEGVSAQR